MRNWTIKEAVETIREGTDFAGMKEIASYNPVFFKAVCENNVSAVAVLMGEKFTLRRLAREVVADVDNDEDDVEEVVAKATTKGKKASVKAEATDKSLEDMTTKELMALCEQRGIKVPKYGKNKAFYLDALSGSDDVDDVEDEDEDVEDDTEETEEKVNPYTGKNAMSLYKMCKDRGIKCEARQKSQVYIDLLIAADNANDEDSDEVDDGWGDEVEDVKPAKSSKSTKTKSTKGSKKSAPVDDDDDEEWDI